jgi:hypothetical protein
VPAIEVSFVVWGWWLWLAGDLRTTDDMAAALFDKL